MSLGGRNTYQLKLEVLSPLFIGGGESANLTRINYCFVPDEKKVCVLDERKWFAYLTEVRLIQDFTQYLQGAAGMRSGGADIFLWLKSKEAKTRTQASAVLKRVASVTHSTAGHPDFKTNDIHGFIKNGDGLPYIPGSSIKGALRTAVIASLLQSSKGKNESCIREISGILESQDQAKNKKKNLESLIRRIEGGILDYQREINGRNESFKGMAGISVSDSAPFLPDNLILVKKRDLSLVDGELKGEGNNKRSLPLYRECARPGTKADFTLTIDHFKIKKEFGIKTMEDLAFALQSHFNALFGPAGVISLWTGSMKFLPPEAVKENGRGIMILGGGAGYHSKSVLSSLAGEPKKANELTKKIMQMNFSRNNHFKDRPLSPRALKVAKAEGKDLFMGFCRISEVRTC